MEISENKPNKNNCSKWYVEKAVESYDFGCQIAIINNKYVITEKGELYSIFYNGKVKIRKQVGRPNSKGYLRGFIDKKDVYIHRLVAKYFCKNPKHYTEVNHKDGNKQNNCADNLEWCTRSQNNRHAFQTGLRNYEELSRIAQKPKLKARKLTDDEVRTIRNSDKSNAELSRIYNLNRSSIYKVRKHITYREVV